MTKRLKGSRIKRAAWLLGALSAVAVVPQAEGEEVCDRCKPATVVWPWKANSYVLGTEDQATHEACQALGEELACNKAFGYIDAKKLTCGFGCESVGEVRTTCARTKKPGCMHGSYEQSPSMWMFVCRKFKGKEGVDSCNAEGAAAEPFWSMCEVFVKAEREQPCACADG